MLTKPVAIKMYSAAGALLAWFAITFQFYLMILNRSASQAETIIRFFGFFTILTNIIVAICFTALLLQSAGSSSFFTRGGTLTATTVYIIIVGLVYNLVLRFLWNPHGLQKVVDELLHSLIPVLFLVFWIVFVPKNQLKWQNAFNWLAYPLVYMIYTAVRGALTGYYPYPFINVGHLGYATTIMNCAGLLIAFIFLSLLLVGIGKLISKQTAVSSAI